MRVAAACTGNAVTSSDPSGDSSPVAPDLMGPENWDGPESDPHSSRYSGGSRVLTASIEKDETSTAEMYSTGTHCQSARRSRQTLLQGICTSAEVYVRLSQAVIANVVVVPDASLLNRRTDIV